MLTKAHCFTIHASGRLSVLETDAQVRSALGSGGRPIFDAKAIWDTGATGTVITQKMVKHCALSPTGMVLTNTANGQRMSEVFLVDIRLPNTVVANSLRVTVGDMGDDGPDMLIGMDIIGHGDFAVTCKGGKTTFSFRLPSLETIDFDASDKKGVSRNDPCPCGSGNKYKNCCKKS